MVKQPDTTVNRSMNSQPFKQIKIINNHIYPRDQVDDVTLKFLNHMESKIASREPDVGFNSFSAGNIGVNFSQDVSWGWDTNFALPHFYFFYSTVLFDEISGNGKVINLVMGIVNIVIAIASIFSVAYIGRKPNLVIGSLLQSVGLLVLLIGFKTSNDKVVLASAILYVRGFCLGLGGAQLIYLGETLPPTGVGIAFGIQSAFSAILGLVIPLLVQAIGPMPLIIFFMVFCFMATVICQVYLIETRNKTAKEIFDEYNDSLTHLLSCPKKQENNPK